MSFLNSLKDRAKADKKTIVLPESYDIRTLEAAHTILAEEIADLIIIGDEAKIAEDGKAFDLSKATIIIQFYYMTDSK